jgi:hypothetical protein
VEATAENGKRRVRCGMSRDRWRQLAVEVEAAMPIRGAGGGDRGWGFQGSERDTAASEREGRERKLSAWALGACAWVTVLIPDQPAAKRPTPKPTVNRAIATAGSSRSARNPGSLELLGIVARRKPKFGCG